MKKNGQLINLLNSCSVDKGVLYTILNTIPVMITVYDPKLRQIYFNQTFEDITGWSNDDSKKLCIVELIYPVIDYGNKVLNRMSSLKNDFKDILLPTKGGQEYKKTSWVNVSLPDGRLIGVGVDISDRVKAETELRESEERFRNMADNISQFAWMADSTGWIFWYNKRWYDYTGTTLEEMEGWGWTKVHHPEHVERVKKHFKKSFESGNNWEDIFPLRSKDGEYRWFLSRAMPIKNNRNEIIRWFGTNTDITERKKAEEAIKLAKEKAEKAVEVQAAFVQNISHEVRTPMNSILGFAELLKKCMKSEKEKKYLEAINSSGHQLLRLIDDIIDLSRLDKKELTLNFKNISLREIFEYSKQHLEGLKLTYKKHNICFEITMPGKTDDIILRTDENRIQQIITNLLSNAIKYTDRGSIELGYNLIENGNEVKIYVKDTGIGIDEKNHPKVFKRFNQFDFSKKKIYGGTGLGLAICKHLTYLFKGVMGFESEPGKGSTFYFTHPVLQDCGTVDSLHEKQLFENIEIPNLKGKVILIAEDDYYSFFMMQSMLEDTGAKILHAENGEDAIKLFEGNKIDLVFLDIRLPSADGFNILSVIRKTNKQIPVIAQTASALPEDKEKSLKAGFTAHTTKPLSIDKLYYLINKYLKL